MIKTILASLSGFGSDRAVLETAIALAKIDGAHLQCLHTRIDAMESSTILSAPGARDMAEMIEKIAAEEADRSRHAKQAFSQAQARHGLILSDKKPEGAAPSMFWQETKTFSFEALHRARYHDLTVVGRDAELSPEPIHTLLMQSGRPVVIAPPKAPETVGRTVAIAWKAGREAAHAVAASLPILTRAEKLLILSVAEEAGEPGEAERLAAYLDGHGLHPEIRRHRGGLAAGAALKEMAYAADADLLVMGAYGHSRIREWVFGGATRDILTECALPVLMCG